MKKQKSRKPLRHKALLVHLFCQHMTKQYNPNLVPIGHGFGFIVFIEEVEDW